MSSMKCFLSITYSWPYYNPNATMWPSIQNGDIGKRITHTNKDLRCLPSGLNSENRAASMKRATLQCARCHWISAFTNSRWSQRQTAIGSRLRWRWRAFKWASLSPWFLTICAEIIWLWKPIVAATGRVSGLILNMNVLDVDVLLWCGVWLHVVCSCGLGWL